MAGGKGTRLKPLTNVIPKPLIPIGDKTILEEIMNQFETIGCQKFYMSINYKSDMIRFYLDQLDHYYDIEFFEEPKPLGTIGSVSLLKGKITTPFFVSNCDIIIDQDLRDVFEYHQNNHNDLTIVTAVKSFKIPYGVIETGEDGLGLHGSLWSALFQNSFSQDQKIPVSDQRVNTFWYTLISKRRLRFRFSDCYDTDRRKSQ